MADYTKDYPALLEEYHQRKIPTDRPGFYDDPSFVAAEERNAEYLNTYARFVDVRPYTAEYFARARDEIPVIAGALARALHEDGRLGACIDASLVLSRVLEREGYWNYIVKGAVEINYPPTAKLPPSVFYAIDLPHPESGKPVGAGHAWVVAPPYIVVDISAKRQPYRRAQQAHSLPDVITATEGEPGELEVLDVYSPEWLLLNGFRPGRLPSLRILDPTVARFTKVFPPRTVKVSGISAKYSPVAIGAPDTAFEEMRGFSPKCPPAADLYRTYVLPDLAAHRSEH